jgi:hypothetical protein
VRRVVIGSRLFERADVDPDLAGAFYGDGES